MGIIVKTEVLKLSFQSRSSPFVRGLVYNGDQSYWLRQSEVVLSENVMFVAVVSKVE